MCMPGRRNWQEQRYMVFKVTEDKKNSIGFPHIYFITHHFKCTANDRLDKLLCVHVCVYMCACLCICNKQMNICYKFWVCYDKHTS